MSSNAGTKVTSDPERFNKPINESAGVITSDSLAGESLASGGDFGSTTGAAASMQPSASTTTNTTDTTNATILAAAPDAEARQAKEDWSEAAQLNAGREITGKNAAFGGSADANDNAASQDDGRFQPKGASLTEGGFQGTEPNASFGTGIGGKGDPGRVALEGFQKAGAQQAADSGRKDEKLSNDGH
ncbi:hypothetical protein CAC42_150 [Sphaceloma murrayae]|uniref:Uncharacterized protein n=1 Tax=Sphaceloma murrayae TaxID=2082308 RepID=A0A2K1QMQ1_9PEZI|nr:hypothetical protein CAC42_150 [Sphaceloma murrayae]